MAGGAAGQRRHRRWTAGEELLSWAIPPEILAAVADSPWAIPADIFARRADTSVAAPEGASYRRAREAVGEGGSVLDVGSGAGAASLPLGCPITAVDVSPDMLAALTTPGAATGPAGAHDRGALARRRRADAGRRRRRVSPRGVQRARSRAVRHRADRTRAAREWCWS